MIVRSGRVARRRGAAMVETAAVFALFMMFLIGTFEFGRLYMMRQLMENAAREGARQAVVQTNVGSLPAIQAVVTNYLAGQTLTNLIISVYESDANGNNIGVWNNAPFGTGIAVQVNASYKLMVPTFGLLPNPVTLQVRSIMRSEAN